MTERPVGGSRFFVGAGWLCAASRPVPHLDHRRAIPRGGAGRALRCPRDTVCPVGVQALTPGGHTSTATCAVFLISLILILLTATSKFCWGQVPAAAVEDIRPAPELALRNGDTLARQRRYEDALLEYKKAYEQIVPRIRKLNFRRSVQARFLPRSQMHQEARREVEARPHATIVHTETLYKVLGLVPPAFDLKGTVTSVLGQNVAGFYDPKTKDLCLIREETKPRGLLGRLLFGPEFDPDEQRATLAHEMTHALADQHYDLSRLGDEFSYQDDYILAVTALVEGEATLVMLCEMLEDRTGEKIRQMPPALLAAQLDGLMTLARWFGGSELKAAPPVITEQLLFPYHKGTVFVNELVFSKGWSGLNEAFLDPPVSTEQILHPEKYLEVRDVPQWIELPNLVSVVASDGWQSLGRNTVGEMMLRILFAKVPNGLQAAAGWDGDRCEVFAKGQDALAVAWFTTWDSPREAHEFAVACSQWFDAVGQWRASSANELPRVNRERAASIKEHWNQPGCSSWKAEWGEAVTWVECRQQDVILVHGFPMAMSEQVAERLWSSQRALWRMLRRIESVDTSDQ
jgi:hypothetical protein